LERHRHAVQNLLEPATAEPARESPVARIARSLARELGLSESETGVISFAAALCDHDAHEGDARTVNAELPALVRPLEAAGVVRETVASRREWWDGTGYPEGLAGEA